MLNTESSRPAAGSVVPVVAPVAAWPGHSQSEVGANAEYGELRRIIRERGLLTRQPGYYTLKIAATLGLLAVGLGLLVVVDNPWLQLLNAVYLAFVFTQIGLMGHDAGHRQITRAAWKNDILGLIFGNLLLGVSREWWVDKHTRHHSHPNQHDLDPDIEVPFIAFDEEQVAGKRGLARQIVKYQAYVLFPLMLLQAIGLHIDSVKFLLQKRVKYAVAEAVLLALHFVLYVGLVWALLGPWPGLLFIIVHEALFGLYMASIFAPNHKGMPTLDAESRLDFLRQQVLTSRNVQGHPLTDFWYGGLNYQIEHHLFPTMPRNKLGEAQKIVQEFCRQRGIAYHETSVLQSYREILQHLHQISAPLRAG